MTKPENPSYFLGELEEPINRYLQVPLAARVVDRLKETRVTPNQVTYVSVLFGLASGYAFSRGGIWSMALGGFLLEITLILDCVDGQLARAKGCASEWGRLIDGIAGYVAYLAVIIGIMVGLQGYYGSTAAIAALTILRAISYDYCKQSMTTMVQKGYDGNQREILDIHQKIGDKRSGVLVAYFYYLQFQQFIFRGRWISLGQFDEEKKKEFCKTLLTGEQRKKYHEKIKILMLLWKWNGLDLPLFLIAFFAVAGVLEVCLTPMAFLMGTQYLLTLIFHQFLIRHEDFS